MKEQTIPQQNIQPPQHPLKGKQALNNIEKVIEKEQSQMIQQIRNIKNSEVEMEANEHLTEEIKNENEKKIKDITKNVLIVEKKLEILGNLKEKEEELEQKQYNQLIRKEIKDYQPTGDSINIRYDELILQPNDSNWTDATQSQADDDQIWLVDDEIVKAMEEQQQQFGEEDQNKQQDNGKEDQQKQEQIDIDELQEQFVTGQESDHQILFGKHDKFCVSVNGVYKNDLLLSGGGDDYLYMYHFPKQEIDKDKPFHPYHMIKHTQTVNKIEISHSKEYIFTMTDNEIFCTEIKTQQTTKLKSKEKANKDQKKQGEKENQMKQKQPTKQNQEQQSDQDEEPICSDMVCHHLGDVVTVSAGYELEIFNIKGLKLYQTYYCDKAIDMIAFTEAGKQIVLACQDYKLRLLTPKTSQIVTVAGVKQHKSEISVIKTKGDIILSGCIDGFIGITTIKKATMTTLIGTKQNADIDASINQLEFAGNYFIAGSSYDNIDWYDLTKAKRLCQSPTEGSASDICWQGSQYQHLYNVSTIKGLIHLFDCRNPLKQVGRTRAGNTIHKLWADSYNLAAACEDGHVRLFDIRKLL